MAKRNLEKLDNQKVKLSKSKEEKILAEETLQKAKKIERPTILLKQGDSQQFRKLKHEIERRRKTKAS